MHPELVITSVKMWICKSIEPSACGDYAKYEPPALLIGSVEGCFWFYDIICHEI